METSKPLSFFQDIRSRELHGFRVRKRPFISDIVLDFSEIGAISVSERSPPLAASFCKTIQNSHILAVADEDGYVNLFDTRHKFSSSSSSSTYYENGERGRVSSWLAHENSVFDVCWAKQGSQVLTASGDQSMKVWDIEENKCMGFLHGHTGSVKSVCPHPTNPNLIASGSRDGSFALWDLRSNSGSKFRSGKICISPTAVVNGAHLPPQTKRGRRQKVASMSVTSVIFLKDELSIATAGAVDSVVKFWDTRNMKSAVNQAGPQTKSIDKERSHGISSLSQDQNGVFLAASCLDNRIYLYNILQPEKGPVSSFSGCQIESFYIKSAISPDAAYILCGSSNATAYIWKVNKPHEDPIALKNHDGDVTAVDWCAFDIGKFATTSDDFTLRLWNTQNTQSTHCSHTISPSSKAKRVMALPTWESINLLSNDQTHDEAFHKIAYSNPITEPEISTPGAQKKLFLSDTDHLNETMEKTPLANRLSLETQKRRLFSDSSLNETFEKNSEDAFDSPSSESKKTRLCSDTDHLSEAFEKTPEASLKSPSSVLNPPSSVKRKTIRDYFLATS